MAATNLTASPVIVSARSLASLEGLRASSAKFSSFGTLKPGTLRQSQFRPFLRQSQFRPLVVKAASVVAPKYTSIKPLGDRVLVKIKEAEEMTMGGILLPSTVQSKPQGGEVVAVGEGRTIGQNKIVITVLVTASLPRKFGKQHRGRLKGISSRGNRICFGRYALQTLEPAWITSRQIEAGRLAMTRYVRRNGKIWVRIFPDKPVTTKPAEMRMGSGKGSPKYWVAVVKPGKILYEMDGVSENIARKAISIAASKMLIKTRFIISQ